MSPPAPLDGDSNASGAPVTSYLTVDGVPAWRAKQPPMSVAVSAASDSDMFKSPVSIPAFVHNNDNIIINKEHCMCVLDIHFLIRR